MQTLPPFQDVSQNSLDRINIVEQRIDTGESAPIRCRSPYHYLTEVDKQENKMLSQGGSLAYHRPLGFSHCAFKEKRARTGLY